MRRHTWKSLSLGTCLLMGCSSITSPSGGGSAANKYDGVYDYSVTVRAVVYQSPRAFVVTNGNISSNPAGFAGTVTDNFGNVRFSGPCPNGATGGAVYTGILNAGNPKFGQGKYTCNNGGAVDNWRVYNGG